LSVRADGMAARAGLRPGDTLVRVGNLQEPSPDQAAEHIRNAWAAGKCAIRLVVSRSGQDFYVPLPLRP
ncbi:MAG TPA: PDZ domain-containing protein, partial [Rhodopila sp.]